MNTKEMSIEELANALEDINCHRYDTLENKLHYDYLLKAASSLRTYDALLNVTPVRTTKPSWEELADNERAFYYNKESRVWYNECGANIRSQFDIGEC